MGQQYFVANSEDGHDMYEINELEGGKLAVTMPDGQVIQVDAYEPEPNQIHMVLGEDGGRAFDLSLRELDATEYEVEVQGRRHTFEVVNERQKRMLVAGVGGRKASGPELVSPMAGKVVAIEAKEGQQVDEGQCVLIVEAMKMENDLKAHLAGTAKRICVTPGQAVEIGDVLAVIEADA